MRVTVLGGSGFLGSHVADQLTTEGHSVRVFDLKESPWLCDEQEMIVGNVCDYRAVELAIRGADAVYNFAAVADIDEALRAPRRTTEVNVLGNLNALEACVASGVERYVFASSVYVYSRHGGFYRCSKQAAELFIEEFCSHADLTYTILRFGSLYGPRSDLNNGLRRIVHSALREGVIKYDGDRDAIRDYIHVGDAARSSVTALGAQYANQHLVLTGPRETKVSELLQMLREILDFKPESVQYVESARSSHYQRTPYSFQPRLGRTLIPTPFVDFGQGLLELIHDVSNEA